MHPSGQQIQHIKLTHADKMQSRLHYCFCGLLDSCLATQSILTDLDNSGRLVIISRQWTSSPAQKNWDSAIQLEYKQDSILNLMIICLDIGIHYRLSGVLIVNCLFPISNLSATRTKYVRMVSGSHCRSVWLVLIRDIQRKVSYCRPEGHSEIKGCSRCALYM